jgi:quercetin dioxygenase-like cupin family protein
LHDPTIHHVPAVPNDTSPGGTLQKNFCIRRTVFWIHHQDHHPKIIMKKHQGLLIAISLTGFAGMNYSSGEPPQPLNPAAIVTAPIRLTPQAIVWTGWPGAEFKSALLEGDPSVAHELFTVRNKFPDHFRIPPHFHPADEYITVISGTFNFGLGDKFDPAKTTAFPAGSFIVIPKGVHHFGWTTGETIIQIQAIGPRGMTLVNSGDEAGLMK